MRSALVTSSRMVTDAAALGIGKTRFESDDVRMLIESEFGAVLDCDDAFFVGDKAR